MIRTRSSLRRIARCLLDTPGRVLASVLLCLAIPAYGGEISPCDDPIILPGPEVNVVVLPYVTGTTDKPELVESGSHLSGLIQTNVLLSILKYGKVGSIRLVGSPDKCNHDRVLSEIVDRYGNNSILANRGLVMVWGRIYEDKNDLFVQSYVLFRRLAHYDVGETFQFPIILSGGPQMLTARLSGQSFAMAPRHLTLQELEEISTVFQSSKIVHTDANDQSPGEPFQIGAKGAWFSVEESRGEWIRIVASHRDNGSRFQQEGWLHAGASLGSTSLNQKLPELDFVEGIVGYLAYSVNRRPSYAVSAEAVLQRYEGQPDSRKSAEADAVAKQLRGWLLTINKGAETSVEDFSKVRDLFAQAAETLSYSAEAKNLDASANAYSTFRNSKKEIALDEIAEGFWSAASLDPKNEHVLANLWSLYKAALDPVYSNRLVGQKINAETIRRDQQALQAVRIDGKVPALEGNTPAIYIAPK